MSTPIHALDPDDDFYRVARYVSIDRTSHETSLDGFALDNIRQAFPGAKTHDGNVTCANNLADLADDGQRGVALIAGHGAPGIVHTEYGAPNRSEDDWINNSNESAWACFDRIRGKISGLIVFACNVGAGELGARLMFRLANRINAPVSGPTGLIFPSPTGQISFQASSLLQRAVPSMSLPPRRLDPPAQTVNGADLSSIRLFTADRAEEVSLATDAGLDLTYHRGVNARTSPLALAGLEKSVFSSIDFAQPFELNGPPLSPITGRLNMKTAESNSEPREFLIFNHALLFDTTSKLYYRTDSAFHGIVSAFL